MSCTQVFDVNVHGVLHTAQAAGRQMARFGNGGSIILIASMSGSVTNRVSLSSSPSSSELGCVSLITPANRYPPTRTKIGCRITQANRLCCKWDGAWHASWVRSASVSILLVRDTSTRRESSFARETYPYH